jgi:hypothetical protein
MSTDEIGQYAKGGKPLSAEERAREIVKRYYGNDNTYPILMNLIIDALIVHCEEREKVALDRLRYAGNQWDYLNRLEQKGYRRGIEEAAEICDLEANAKRQCAPANKDHDDRWCPTCDAMEDMALVLAERIRNLKS